MPRPLRRKSQGFDIPILVDELQLVGESLGVQREGEIFVVDPKNGFKIAYHGPLKETGCGARRCCRRQAGRQCARRSEIWRDHRLPGPRQVGRVQEHLVLENVTKIIQDKCVTCHQNGGIAPFAMDSYDVVKTMAPMIRESVRSSNGCLPTSPIRISATSRTTRA
jgi:hypothetical protein